MLEGVIKIQNINYCIQFNMKYIIVKHSVNIKYIMVKAFMFKMLVKTQKIVKQANSI